MFKWMQSHRSVIFTLVVSLIVTGLLGASQIGVIANSVSQLNQPQAIDPSEMVQNALKQAQLAGTYRIAIDVQQTITLDNAPEGYYSSLRVDGEIAGPDQARFVINDGQLRVSSYQDQADSPSEEEEILVSSGKIFKRKGDQWVEQSQGLSAPGLTGNGLLLLDVAKDHQLLEPIGTLGGTFERVAFTLESRDVLRMLVQQSGQYDSDAELRLALSGMYYGGTG